MGENSVNYREFHASDMAAILDLHVQEMRELHKVTDAEARSAAVQYAARCPASTLIWIAEDAGNIVGFARGEFHDNMPFTRLKTVPRAGYIDEIYVIPSYRKRRVAERLLRSLIAALWAADVACIWGVPNGDVLRQLWAAMGATDMGAMMATRDASVSGP